ncbi:hypothetical protein CcaverHIS002_0208030 [Cutaneotrichosporon cavernicola]|uniref:Amino acid transporter transmembrane domain-containing protein n=1 Tax=Cutaneotrichosporon cavernicola TaxID=279322 RepID=A0AA48I7U0_9TREE|nr:uncharacterized protein CcaverHIS019_0208020 [Cutaneotrichosporon cavernicola]BEI81643.1 hypothetical protein CcaverHIS002_0208030 [Cutaneotrichosporon cavernicola]BEI89440.1 hypothetical protein CcaverHIS019_0208020 [Cutaneotrichosporon cavernicola]BEI97214.1 hypothetical protein CcaverHIS631_0208030 [Cutaneotrichosporon cavernicola]BEJ04988.1 hypothetical protein CcaverHIS641_0208050 [Cutaneotrichosporon cavernicola]
MSHFDSEKHAIDQAEKRHSVNGGVQAGKDNNYAIEIAPAGQSQHVQDAVFGDMGDDGPNYRAVGALGAFALMTKANIGIGVLSIPFVFMEVGMVPGVILLLVINLIIMYCACIIGDFKMNHPEVYAIADAGFVVGGRFGREYFGLAFVLFMIFVSASGILTIATALNAVSSTATHHGACTAIFMAVSAVSGFLLAQLRTLGKISWIGWVGLVSIMAAILTLTIAVGVQERPYLAAKEYPTGPWPKNLKITNNPPFSTAMSAINSIVFAFAATPTYFGIISEMRDPRSYKRTMCTSMGILYCVYATIGIVVYYFCGQYVASPALGSAGPTMKKVAYGIAIPALLASVCIYLHLAAKYFFVRILSGTPHLSSSTKIHWVTWYSCVTISALVAYIIASAIPIFSNLISLIGALIGPSVCIAPYAWMWYHDNWKLNLSGRRNVFMLAFNAFLFALAIFFTGAGTYGAIVAIINDPNRSKPWDCADNSNTVETNK